MIFTRHVHVVDDHLVLNDVARNAVLFEQRMGVNNRIRHTAKIAAEGNFLRVCKAGIGKAAQRELHLIRRIIKRWAARRTDIFHARIFQELFGEMPAREEEALLAARTFWQLRFQIFLLLNTDAHDHNRHVQLFKDEGFRRCRIAGPQKIG
ncbi:hypothetical protein D3C79_876680 [compost metagenome]